ncbi:MAG: bifunctional phosphopantothenoylcysteine decarboxylase/phosphopantothenate--cysteine ligase CoaBC [Rhodanobacteraceae bacterium]
MNSVPLAGVKVLLGVSGGIAAYKAAELVRRLRDAGADVMVVMTESAARFVTPLTFQALSGHPVRSSLWDEAAEAAMGHIELARWADQILVAPASADVIARLAHGQADDLLTTLCLASAALVAIAPAMNQQMWVHPATQANVESLRARGASVLGPASGSQACGDIGPGRLLDPQDIVAALVAARGPRLLAGISVLVNAGPTFEDIDPVRYIGNRSSGRMGFAVAAAAADQGADVTLVAGPVALTTPRSVTRIDVRSAAEMRDVIAKLAPKQDIFIASAAVGDFRPLTAASSKIKKNDEPVTLTLVQNPDILAEIAELPKRPFIVGFAAETDALEENASKKLRDKRIDMIAANQVSSGHGFGDAENALLLLWPNGREELGRTDKEALARKLVMRIAERYGATLDRRGPGS